MVPCSKDALIAGGPVTPIPRKYGLPTPIPALMTLLLTLKSCENNDPEYIKIIDKATEIFLIL
jgi:hypothetical protein